jgi:hypothetical protein
MTFYLFPFNVLISEHSFPKFYGKINQVYPFRNGTPSQKRLLSPQRVFESH